MKNPWKKLSSKIVYKNAWIKVCEDKVIRPDKKKGIYGVIEVNNSVVIVALTKNKEVYLVRQWRYTLNCSTIELPWGGSKKGEKPLTAAKRELKEETGLLANRWISLGYLHDYPGISTERVYIFLAREIVVGKCKPDGTEELNILKVSFRKACKWSITGKIRDAVTIASLLKVKKYLNL